MKEIIVKTQAELDAVPKDFDGLIIIKGGFLLNPIEAYDSSHVEAHGSSHVVAYDSSHVEAYDSSHVVAYDSSHVEAHGSSHVVAYNSSHVVAYDSSNVVAHNSSNVVAYDSSHVVAYDSSHVVAYDSSNVVAYDSSHVEAHGSSHVEAHDSSHVQLYWTAVCHLFSGDVSISVNSPLARVVEKPIIRDARHWLDLNGIPNPGETVTLYKRVSTDFLTQEGEVWETAWLPGTTNAHPAWSPAISECGAGKFHACMTPGCCDQYRNKEGDRHVAIEIAVADLYAWPDPEYTTKIAFRAGKVLYEVDRDGVRI